MKYSSSVDMISFISVMSDDDFFKYNNYFQLMPEASLWVGTAYKQYRYNYKIECDDSSYYVGFQHNSEKFEGGYHSLKIEFNPNKIIVDGVLKDLLVYCFLRSETKIKSVDIAFDLEIPFDNYILDRGLKHDVNVYKGTLYIGSRSDGVKIYDKQKESGLPTPLTRYEIRIPLNCILDYIGFIESIDFQSLPTLTFIDTLPIDTFDRIVILGLMQDPGALNNFSRRRKEKYREYLKTYTQFSPSSNEIIQCILSYMQDLRLWLGLEAF